MLAQIKTTAHLPTTRVRRYHYVRARSSLSPINFQPSLSYRTLGLQSPSRVQTPAARAEKAQILTPKETPSQGLRKQCR